VNEDAQHATLHMQAGRPLPAYIARKFRAQDRTLVLCAVAAAPAAAEPQTCIICRTTCTPKLDTDHRQRKACDCKTPCMQAGRHTRLCIHSKKAPAVADRGKLPVLAPCCAEIHARLIFIKAPPFSMHQLRCWMLMFSTGQSFVWSSGSTLCPLHNIHCTGQQPHACQNMSTWSSPAMSGIVAKLANSDGQFRVQPIAQLDCAN
jgi:hypothetical protein